MANEQNLKPFSSDQSREEAAKNGKKGGVASGEAKRKKKALKKTIEMVMSLPVDEGTRQALEKLGIAEDEQNVQTAVIVGQALKAMRGDTKAADFIVKYLGCDPHIELEKERVKLEKKRVELQEQMLNLPTTDGDGDEDDVHIYLPDNGRDDDG